MKTVCAMLLLLAAGPLAPAADHYVDGKGGDGLAEGGNDGHSGTLEAPWLTLVHATQQLKPGDTLYIRGGAYAEYPKDNIPSGTPEARVTVSNYKDEVVIIRPAVSTDEDSVISIKGKCYITLRGLILDGHNGATRIHQHTLVIWGSEPLPHHIRVENSTMMNGYCSGICSGTTSESEFINLKVHHNGQNKLHHGIYLQRDNNIIDGCEFSYNSGFGIHIYTSAPFQADNNVIRNCYSHHNKIAGAIIGVGRGNVAYNNIFANNPFGCWIRGDNTKFYNNTLYGNQQGVDVKNTTNAEIKNNIIVGANSGIAEFLEKKAEPAGKGAERGGKQTEIQTPAHPGQAHKGAERGAQQTGGAGQQTEVQVPAGRGQADKQVPAGRGQADKQVPAGRGGATGGRAAAHAATNTDPVVSDNFTEGDPMFVDPEKGDFRLKEGSPAVGFGAVLELDSDGVARPRAPKSWAQRPEFQVGPFIANDPSEIMPPEPPLPPHDPVTYVVAPDGNDENPGTEEKPWATLSKAAGSVDRGDTVRIRAGVYAKTRGGQSAWVFTKAGAKEAPITYKAYGDGEVVLSAGEVVPPESWKHVKGAIYSTPRDLQGGLGSVFCNGLPLVGPGPNHPVPSVDEMYPNSFYTDASTLYVWLADGSNPAKSDMRTASLNVVGLNLCNYTVFEGLTLEYGFRGSHAHHRATHSITIRNCIIRSIASQGVIPIPENSVLEGNTFQKIGSTKFNHALYGSPAGLVVRNNVFEEISGAAVHQYGASGEHGALIYGNVFRKPRRYWDSKPHERYETGVILWSHDMNCVYNNVFYGEGKRPAVSTTRAKNRIFNNTFIGCRGAVRFVGPNSRDNYVQNNIFLDCEPFVFWPKEAPPQKTLDYNIYFSTRGAPNWQCVGKEYATFEEYQQAAGEAHSRYADPGLVGPADAHLKAGSPAIDAGAVLKVGLLPQEIGDDAEGVTRPQGSAPDIGAYEVKRPPF